MSVQEDFYRAGGHHSSLQIIDDAAIRIAITIPRDCASTSDFIRSYLDGAPRTKNDEDFPINNHVRPDPEGTRFGSCSSLVVFIRNLAKAIKEEPMQMSPWPNFKISDEAYEELNEGNPESFAAQAQESFKWSTSVHNNQRVSSHLYFIGIFGWHEGAPAKPAVYALFTELFQCNIRETFSSEGDRFSFTDNEPFTWPVLLHREGSDNNTYETLIPKPNFSMLVDGVPRLLIQICSDPDEQSDLWLLLLSMAAVLRTLHEFKVKANSPSSKPSREAIVVAYIKDSQAVTYILYLVPRLDPDNVTAHEVRYTRDVYNLEDPTHTCTFAKLMYLFAQRIKDEGRPTIPWNNALSSVGEWTRRKELVTTLKHN